MSCAESSDAILQNRNLMLPDQARTGRLSMSCSDLTRITQVIVFFDKNVLNY